MKKLFTPFGHDGRGHVHIADVSKRQLAKTVNAQASRLKQQDEWIKSVGRVLITLVTTPSAVRHDPDGTMVVSSAALQDVVAGTQLKMEVGAGLLRLSVLPPSGDHPGASRIVMPS